MESKRLYEKPVLIKYESLKKVTLGMSCEGGAMIAGYDVNCSPIGC